MAQTHMLIKVLIVLLLIGPLNIAMADANPPLKPSKADRCPVCGMFVYKYPDWTAEIVLDDGSVYFFDGAKDFFKFYFNLKSYRPHKTHADITAAYVTEYYDVEFIDARKAFFVIGSDTYGPMGRELIPFRSEADARGFMKDHKGQRVLKFKNVKSSVIDKLD